MKKTTDLCFYTSTISSYDDFAAHTSEPETFTIRPQLSLDLDFWNVEGCPWLIRPCEGVEELERVVEGFKAELDAIVAEARIRVQQPPGRSYHLLRELGKRKAN